MDKRRREIIHGYKPILSETISYDRIKLLVKKYKIFTKAMFDDIFDPKCERNFYDELCTRGPDAFSKFIMVLKSAGYYEAADTLQNKIDNEQFPNYYKMDSVPYIGYCLIIMNQIFDIEDYYRMGCQVDADALKDLFEKLKYDVEIKWNKEEHEIVSILREFSKKPEFGNADSCIVYILSHGGQSENLDYILGTNSRKVYKKDIYNIFNNKNCKLLIGKPKIFFFQACRGELPGYAVSENSCDANDNTKSQNSTESADASSPKFDKDKIVKPKYPFCTDMFIVHSSLPDHKSYKNHLAGSWLCQDLVSVVSEYYDKHDLATMMTFVNSKQMNRESEDGCKQIAHLEQIGVTRLLQFKRSGKGATSSKTS